MANETIRIKDQPLDTALSPGDLIIVDSEESGVGTRKFDLGTELTDIKQDLEELQEEIEGGGSGLTAEAKAALIACFNNVAWDDTDGQEYINALYDALYPPVTAINLNTNSLSFVTLNSTQQLTATTTPAGGAVTWSSSNTAVATVSSSGLVTSVGYGSATITATSGSVSATCSVTIAQATVTSISAVYTQSGTVYDDTSLNSLKSDLVVTASWSNGTTSIVPASDYTLSGTLAVGTSTITVSYSGVTTTFTVTVSEVVIDYTLDALSGVNWMGGYNYNASTGELYEASGEQCTEKFTVQPGCFYSIMPSVSNSWHSIFEWDSEGNYIGTFGNSGKLGNVSLLSGHQYAVKVNYSGTLVSNATMLPINNTETKTSQIEIDLAANVESMTWVTASLAAELNITSIVSGYGVTTSNYTTKFNSVKKCRVLLGKNMLNNSDITGFTNDIIYSIGKYSTNINLQIKIKNLTSLEDVKSFITANAIKIVFN